MAEVLEVHSLHSRGASLLELNVFSTERRAFLLLSYKFLVRSSSWHQQTKSVLLIICLKTELHRDFYGRLVYVRERRFQRSFLSFSFQSFEVQSLKLRAFKVLKPFNRSLRETGQCFVNFYFYKLWSIETIQLSPEHFRYLLAIFRYLLTMQTLSLVSQPLSETVRLA